MAAEGDAAARPYIDLRRTAEMSLPERRCVAALRELDASRVLAECDYNRECEVMEARYYRARYLPLFDKRRQLVLGQYTAQEGDINADYLAELSKGGDDGVAGGGDVAVGGDGGGMKMFWTTALYHCTYLRAMINDDDWPVLHHLSHISCQQNEQEPLGFRLFFEFTRNPYFSNATLIKEYEVRCEPPRDNVFLFEGPEIYRAKPFVIDWHPGKNVTIHHVDGAAPGGIPKPKHSFFNFFTPPVEALAGLPDKERTKELEKYMIRDFQIGHYLKETFLPRATLYYLDEIEESEADTEDSSFSDDEDDEDENYDRGLDDDDDDDDGDVSDESESDGQEGGDRRSRKEEFLKGKDFAESQL